MLPQEFHLSRSPPFTPEGTIGSTAAPESEPFTARFKRCDTLVQDAFHRPEARSFESSKACRIHCAFLRFCLAPLSSTMGSPSLSRTSVHRELIWSPLRFASRLVSRGLEEMLLADLCNRHSIRALVNRVVLEHAANCADRRPRWTEAQYDQGARPSFWDDPASSGGAVDVALPTSTRTSTPLVMKHDGRVSLEAMPPCRGVVGRVPS